MATGCLRGRKKGKRASKQPKTGKKPTRGERNCAWIEKYCRVPEGKHVGQAVKLRTWQRAEICKIYDSPTRLAILSFGRKNGKTALVAFLLLLHLVGPEAVANSQLYSAAQSRAQAAIVYRYASQMVRLSPDLASHVTPRESAKELAAPELGTLYRALSAEAATAYGFSPIFTVHDELGQVRGPRSDLFDALETASGAHESPLSVIISTQAPNDTDLLSMLIDEALTGADPQTKVSLHAAPIDSDPWSEETWKLANPAYGDFLNPAEVATQARRAKALPAQEPAFRNLVLNQRVEARSPLIPRSLWMRCGGETALYAGEPMFIGLDLSSTTDLTALVRVWKSGSIWQVQPTFWVPEVGLYERARRDRVPYDTWAAQGLIETTPGASVDYDYVAQWLLQAQQAEGWAIEQVAFDRWRIDLFKAALSRQGAADDFLLQMVEFGQGFQSMSPAIDILETELLNGTLAHGAHPVLTMCAANAVAVRDPAGNRKADKAKSTGRIDGLVALLMGLARASAFYSAAGAFDDFLSNPVRG